MWYPKLHLYTYCYCDHFISSNLNSVFMSLPLIFKSFEVDTLFSFNLHFYSVLRVAITHTYRIYSAIRRGFHLSRMTTNNLISSM